MRRATAREGRRGPKARDFYPRSPCGERPRQVDTVRLARLDFYPRSPCGERLDQFAVRRGAGGISIHALLAESDDTYSSWFFIMPIFLSTLSLRRATPAADLYDGPDRISIHALLAESDPAQRSKGIGRFIFLSKLSLRRATNAQTAEVQPLDISIHALLAESDVRSFLAPFFIKEFLSTLSLRRATDLRFRCSPGSRNFYPRSPCGERRDGDPSVAHIVHISIHALLAESDALGISRRELCRHFYPRSPCGERRKPGNIPALPVAFLSTLSLRRATRLYRPARPLQGISIHALLAESDLCRG